MQWVTIHSKLSPLNLTYTHRSRAHLAAKICITELAKLVCVFGTVLDALRMAAQWNSKSQPHAPISTDVPRLPLCTQEHCLLNNIVIILAAIPRHIDPSCRKKYREGCLTCFSYLVSHALSERTRWSIAEVVISLHRCYTEERSQAFKRYKTQDRMSSELCQSSVSLRFKKERAAELGHALLPSTFQILYIML